MKPRFWPPVSWDGIEYGGPERQERIERAVDQTDQQLAEERLRRDAEDLGHAVLLNQLAAAVLLGTERLLRRDRGADLVVVPGPLRFRRLLHFEQQRVVD